MKPQGLVLLLTLLFASKSFAQNTLTVASWNIEWFGSASNGPADDNLQEANVKTVLRYLNADIYGLVEVVDTMRFRRVVDSLGTNYKYVIADFCSNNTTGTGNSWLTGQKEAYIYNKNIFNNVKVRGMMRNSNTAYSNYASGRFPYLLNADVTKNGVTRNINFILIHGKSGSTQSDYDKRKGATQELKDTLDAFFANQNIIIVGDYNDALNTTICTSCTSQLSSYDPLIKDSAHFKSITMPLALAGQTTMINYPNVIDNHVVSVPMNSFYVANSVQIRIDATALIPNYQSNNTSDHYPVTSKYNFTGTTTAIPTVTASQLKVSFYPNPFAAQLNIAFGKTLTNVQLQLSDVQGKILVTQQYNRIAEGSTLKPWFSNLAKGIYFLGIATADYQTVIKLVKL